MRNSYLIFSFACILILMGCGSKQNAVTKAPKGVNFIKTESLSQVLDKAEKDGKAVFIDVYADWCVPCKVMDEEVFAFKTTADFMNKNFINVKVDAEKGNGPNIASLYNVYALPTLLFVDSKGRVLERMDGSVGHTELVAMGNRALEGNQGIR